MDTNSVNKLKRKIFFIFPLGFIMLAVILMLSAGTLKYWQGWLYCAVIFSPAFFVTSYFLKRAPEFLERRMKFKEKEVKQKKIIIIADIFFLVGIIIPGLDYRFGWSAVPFWLVLVSDIAIIACYYVVFLAFKENVFAGRTVEIFKEQKVISTGPYAIVRHPMYSGMIPLFLFTPLALGSYWAIIPYIPVSLVIILRILNEEEVLKRELAGYKEYCQKVRYRLIPFVW